MCSDLVVSSINVFNFEASREKLPLLKKRHNAHHALIRGNQSPAGDNNVISDYYSLSKHHKRNAIILTR